VKRIFKCLKRTISNELIHNSNDGNLEVIGYCDFDGEEMLAPKIPSVFLTNFWNFWPSWRNPFLYQKKYENLRK
jgi:hypothetical protein